MDTPRWVKVEDRVGGGPLESGKWSGLDELDREIARRN